MACQHVQSYFFASWIKAEFQTINNSLDVGPEFFEFGIEDYLKELHMSMHGRKCHHAAKLLATLRFVEFFFDGK